MTPPSPQSPMPSLRRLVLDVLKPHQPNAVDFASTLANLAPVRRVKLTVTEVDKKTESIILEVEGDDLQFQQLSAEITKMGASVHSIDEVEVDGNGEEIG